MRPFGFSPELAARRRAKSGVPTPSPAPAPPFGFAANGSTNPALKAMLARVIAGTGRGRLIIAGDSTTVGQGAGVTGEPTFTGARANRVPVVLARLLRSGGVTSHDHSLVGDHAIKQASGSATRYFEYDPRAVMSGWLNNYSAAVAGGSLYGPAGAGATFSLTPDAPVDTFELVLYNVGTGSVAVAIDGAAPSVGGSNAGTASTGGFTRFVYKAASVGAHTLTLTSDGSDINLRSISAYDSTTKAIEVLAFAMCGGLSVEANGQNTDAYGGQFAGDALLFDAPDLTIVNFGINEMFGTSTGAYAAALGGLVDKARVSGDALLVFPYPIGTRDTTTMQAYRDVAAGVAAAKGVAFMSLLDYFGGAFTPALAARMIDQVHGKADLYAEVADVYRRCIQAMAV